MSAKPPTKDERNQNLEDLKKAVEDWAKSEKTRLENEVKFMRAVLKGRAASSTAQDNLAAISLKLVAEINQFLIAVG
jgi:hypothetical protein